MENRYKTKQNETFKQLKHCQIHVSQTEGP